MVVAAATDLDDLLADGMHGPPRPKPEWLDCYLFT
jgi:uncharacterized protein YueI